MTTRHSRIGKFEIIQPLGEGAMGSVFLARDTIIGREVALKTIHSSAVPSSEARERFFREAQAASRLNHPNLVTIHEAGEAGGTLYLAMEYVGGDNLARTLKEQTLRPLEVLELLAQVCDGLAYAHAKGVIHKDIKPSNIRVARVSGRPTAKILDFGITRLAGSDLSGTGSITGTFAYMAPEHTQSGKADTRTDLFAVGVILYEALAGFRPFDGENAAVILNRLMTEDPAPLDLEKLATISPAIQGVLDKALAKDPARRFTSASALAAALRSARNPAWSPEADAERMERMARSLLVPGLKPPPPPKEVREGGSSWLWLLAMAAVIAALGAGGWLWLRHRHRRPAPVAVVQPAPQPAPPVAPPVVTPPPETPAPEAAEPAPEPAKPASKSTYRTLDEADAALDKNPAGALAFLEAAVAADPSSERSQALRMVALYDLGRYGPCAKAMGEAKASGHTLLALSLKYPRFKKMLAAEKADPKLPRRAKPAR
jgi:serine/threonine-protein kinase